MFRPKSRVCLKLLWGYLGVLLCWIILWGYPQALSSVAQQYLPIGNNIAIRQTQYEEWDNAWLLSNDQVEVVVVPEIGRIMQFHFKDRASPLWENPAPKRPSLTTRWMNFGGDKVWPAPQSDWNAIIGRSWPPPVTFDAMPVEAQIKDGIVTLIYPVDPDYGIQAYRTIRLDSKEATMVVTSTFEKVYGPSKSISVWTVTQLQDPIKLYALLHQSSTIPDGYIRLSQTLPANLNIMNGILSLSRDPKARHKIGMAADQLLWVGAADMMLIESSRLKNEHYPDGESNAEIYTNSDPKAYVELEFLSPLKLLKAGDQLHLTTTYKLMHRTHKNPDIEAKKLL